MPAGAPGFHDRFFNELNQMGYPQNSRNISVINGTLDGSPINDFGQQYLNLNARAILGTLRTDLKLNYSPIPGNTINDLDFRLYLRFPLLKITLFKRKRSVSSLSSLGSLENSPAGYNDVDQLADKFLEGDFYGIFGNTSGTVLEQFMRDILLYIDVTLTDPNFSFVPTKSSLDFIGNPYLYEKIGNRNLVCSQETPFDSYYAPEVSQKHIFLSSPAADFIKDEINGIHREPTVEPSTEALTGPEIVCSNSVTFNFDTCSGTLSNWQVSSNLQIVSSNSYSITVKAIGNGEGFIDAVLPTATVRKDVYVNKPDIDVTLDSSAPDTEAYAIVTGGSTLIENQQINQYPYYTVVSSSGYSNVYIYEGLDDGYIVKGIGSTNTWNKTIDFYISNNCGTTVERITLTPPPPSGGCNYTLQSTGINTYSLLPPPDCLSSFQTMTSNESSVMMNSEIASPNIFSIKVYNMNGALQLETNEQSISLESFKNGFYIIKATWNGNETTKKVAKS